jgi:Fe-S-cluster containining protein
MGEAKRRNTEIETLKRLSPEDQASQRQSKHDQELIVRGIDPNSNNPEPTAAMARVLVSRFETAKDEKTIIPVVNYLHSKVDATLSDLNNIPVSCQKGCSHCCNIWVSASAPEVLFVAKIVSAMGQNSIDKVLAANNYTKNYNFDSRYQHPHPCPLLDNDVCSIYNSRPNACRLAASVDSEKCKRSYLNGTEEDIPSPITYLKARNVYAIALALSLKKVALPYAAYEFNAALVRALETDDAEKKWLSGEDIFAGIMNDPDDIFLLEDTQRFYQLAFG